MILNPSPVRRPTMLAAALDDGQLLERFVQNRDETAFAALVTRHGPLVLGVCRRVLHHQQDTEDAFQATFVVLARKARSICKQTSLASWLYKVAYRIALRARAANARRRLPEHRPQATYAPSPLGEVVQAELRRVLDEEVQRLPEKYRAPILLCYLEGQTNEKAAEQLHCPTGTVKIRLARGREMLRKRLTRRGIGLSALSLAAALVYDVAAAVPPSLATATLQAAVGGVAPVAVTQLVGGALKAMCWTKLKIAAAVLLTVLIGTLADGLSQRNQVAAAQPVPSKEVRPSVPTPEVPQYRQTPAPPGERMLVQVQPQNGIAQKL